MNESERDTTEDEPAYDMALATAVADIIAIKVLLMDNRPLEALKMAKEAEEQHRDALPDHVQQDES